MNRRKSRETAFLILFEKIFNNDVNIEDIVKTAQFVREFEVDDFTLNVVNGVLTNMDEIDQKIEQNAKNWKKDRISKTSLVLLRISVYEIIFSAEVPTSVAINEAVELSKKYSTKEDTSFINGVLGGVARNNV